MQPFYSTFTALVVTTIYILWQRFSDGRLRRDRAIQERVTYMLWTIASQVQ
jgi:hypothetical protein